MTGTAQVYFWPLTATRKAPVATRIKGLVRSTGFLSDLPQGLLTAVKMHFGERGCTGFINPTLAAPLIRLLRKSGCRPFLTDTNTLYPGERQESVSHLLLAAHHGFEALRLEAPVIIADGLRGNFERACLGPPGHFTYFYLAGEIADADILVSMAHFKGHEIAGFGGTLKNLGMGCASRRGKIAQHCGAGPRLIEDKCQGCGACIPRCRHKALCLGNGRVILDADLCVGCGACISACKHHALVLDWKSKGRDFMERMVEYAGAVAMAHSFPSLYLNFIINVTPECDCTGYSDAPICPDMGIVAGTDPVAVDQAAYDLVNSAPVLNQNRMPEDLTPGEDKFRALRPDINGAYALQYAESLGIGRRSYHLTRLD